MDEATAPSNFIRDVIDADLGAGTVKTVVTRFPPEPNGYLHMGHAKSICLNFGLAKHYGAKYPGSRCHLRFDDTNPDKEESEYVAAIQRDIRWLGFDWQEHLFFASDYFDKLYQFAVELIRGGKAYVCSLSESEMRETRGSVTEAGTASPYRDRSVEENETLFQRMRAGDFPDGEHTLRAKIDMGHANMKLRDPALYRIRRAHHHRTGNVWCIYPLYDFAHGLSDALEGVTHSICTLEFENNRPLYDWFITHCSTPATPHQYEFARLNLSYTLMSKRKLLTLVQGGHVAGWDDPRMPTLAGMRRRGVTPEAIRSLCEQVGVAKANSVVDVAQLEFCIRADLNHKAPRVMAVIDPLRLVIEDYPADTVEEFDAPYWPHDIPLEGGRTIHFTRELYIERADFAERPPKNFYRLSPGGEVRLRYGYVIRCEQVIKNSAGEVVELRCSHDPSTRGGTSPTGRKIKGTIHWVSCAHAIDAEVRLYDRLFRTEFPQGQPEELNPHSLVVAQAKVEASLATAVEGQRFQFERQGYFAVDQDSRPAGLVFNRTIALRDSWGKKERAVVDRPKARQEKKAATRGTATPQLTAAAAALADKYRIAAADASVLLAHDELLRLFTAGCDQAKQPRVLAKWLVNTVQATLKGLSGTALPFGHGPLVQLVNMIDAGDLADKGARLVFAAMVEGPERDPQVLLDRLGLAQRSDVDSVQEAVDQVLQAHADSIAKYRAGKTNVLGFLVGQVMRAGRGRADPKLVNELILKRLALF